MAEQLKRENDILTLRIALAGGDAVRCDLQSRRGGAFESRTLWEGDARAFGVAGRAASAAWAVTADFRLPQALVEDLAAGLAEWQDVPARTPSLWVHLLKPYGALRVVPWTRLLVEALHVPVLMLPDFIFPPPCESDAELDVALCASAPLNCGANGVFDGLMATIEAAREALDGRPYRLHVFTDEAMTHQLQHVLVPFDELIVHPPEGARPFVEVDPASRRLDSSGRLRSPWLLWMREALRPYTTDAVHFVCHGHLSGAHGALLLAQSPLGRTDDYFSGPVGCTELASFATQVGSWATGFTATRDNHDPAGMRALADEVAQTLPGPMLLYDSAHGPPDHLAAGLRFVHGTEPQAPPCTPALVLYCQPYLLREDRGGIASGEDIARSVLTRIEGAARSAAQRTSALWSVSAAKLVDDGYIDFGAAGASVVAGAVGRSVSAVTAATERVAEQVQVQYQQLMRDEVVPEDIAHRDLASAMETMDRVRQAVNGIERKRLARQVDAGLADINRIVSDYVRAQDASGPLHMSQRLLSSDELPGLSTDFADVLREMGTDWSRLSELAQGTGLRGGATGPENPIDFSALEARIVETVDIAEDNALRARDTTESQRGDNQIHPHSSLEEANAQTQSGPARTGLLVSDPSHLDHGIYQQAMVSLAQFGPDGGFTSHDVLEKAAAAIAADARLSGLTRIDLVVLSSDGSGLIAVQGDPQSESARRTYLAYDQATTRSIELSSRMLDSALPVQAAPTSLDEDIDDIDHIAGGAA